ncbi:hypothetical protein KFL_008830020 [Klebsormidium nitens]|uniref:Bro-N domain-containing protein n=1 Tax=Klebsormidium nitens TaxID=105231 RepID=A0A1Y1IM20_KLENI|nr:hypothetical protein KFL_008830020 [Klebsormidium nitens]|eukprot:GAQ91920.1 hypothetical protein KFL_008830020 [Klebsormidium nitens]
MAKLIERGGPVLGPRGSQIQPDPNWTPNDLESRYVNESGLYELILKSNLPSATAFQDWVVDEVLPSIRKSGQYSHAADHLRTLTVEVERQYIYLAMVQEEPLRIAKYGRTIRKTTERYAENRRKYTKPFFFHPVIEMEVDDAVKAEKFFSKLPEIVDNKHSIKTTLGMDNETFIVPPTLTIQKLHFLMRKAAALSVSKDLLMGHVTGEDKEVTLAKLTLETRRLETDHDYRMEVLKRGEDAVVTIAVPAKKRKVTVTERDNSQETVEETSMEDMGGELVEESTMEYVEGEDATNFDKKVQDFIRSMCEFGIDDRSARTVDRFRTDKVYLHQEFVKLHGKTSPGKFYAACQQLKGVEPVTVCVEDRHIKAFSSIRLKKRSPLLSGEILMNRYLEEKCNAGDDSYCIGKLEFYQNFTQYAKQFVKEDAMTYKHGFSANAFNKFLTSKGISVSRTTWRGAWGKICVGVRPYVGYPTVEEIISVFLEKRSEDREGANVGRPELLSALTTFVRHHYVIAPVVPKDAPTMLFDATSGPRTVRLLAKEADPAAIVRPFDPVSVPANVDGPEVTEMPFDATRAPANVEDPDVTESPFDDVMPPAVTIGPATARLLANVAVPAAIVRPFDPVSVPANVEDPEVTEMPFEDVMPPAQENGPVTRSFPVSGASDIKHVSLEFSQITEFDVLFGTLVLNAGAFLPSNDAQEMPFAADLLDPDDA